MRHYHKDIPFLCSSFSLSISSVLLITCFPFKAFLTLMFRNSEHFSRRMKSREKGVSYLYQKLLPDALAFVKLLVWLMEVVPTPAFRKD